MVLVRFPGRLALLLFLTALVPSLGAQPGGPAAAARTSHETKLIVIQLERLTNDYRLKEGLPALGSSDYLQEAALGHSAEMTRLGYFAHQSPTPGRATLRERITAVGGKDKFVGENIYQCKGIADKDVAQRAVNAWIKSPSHQKNLAHPDFQSFGFGVVREGDTVTVVQNFSSAAARPVASGR